MTEDDPQTVRTDRITFYPVIVLAAIFCISIFIVIAATFGDPNIPLNKLINRHANSVLIVETVLLTLTTLGAMTVDRLRTLRKLAQQTDDSTPDSSQQEESDVG